jgi:hypothetical protein
LQLEEGEAATEANASWAARREDVRGIAMVDDGGWIDCVACVERTRIGVESSTKALMGG